MRERTKTSRDPRSKTGQGRRGICRRILVGASTTTLALTLMFPAVAMAGPMGEADFTDPSITTFDGLDLSFFAPTPLTIDGHTLDTDTGMARYMPPSVPDCVGGECVGTSDDRGYLDILLSRPMQRAGVWVGTSAATVEFFDEGGSRLGSVDVAPVTGLALDFAGWEADTGAIARIRVTDTEINTMVVTVDNLTTEDSVASTSDQVEIDIRPGSDSNPINLSSRVVPVAILTSSSFDASTVDPDTVTLAGATVRARGKQGPSGSLIDVDGDGDEDLLLLIEARELELGHDDVEATLIGWTYAGAPIEGTDSVRIVP